MKLFNLIGSRRGVRPAAPAIGPSLGRHRTCDISFTYRMGAGFAGDVNRGHPASIQPCLIDAAAPPTAFGQAVLVDPASQGVRPLVIGDVGVVDIWGVTVRPYPFNQPTTANFFGAVGVGAGSPATLQPIDVMRAGYILVSVVGNPVKGGAVFVWVAASGGGHVQGGFEAAATGGSTAALSSRYLWNSPPDASGIAELTISF